ncbi:TSUP family transporter [Microvirga tunisiensis]|uniref:TSUP family transporter n=2 Tax=Pannonibacter tanglangensis TaxID=2750084 RepID=A0ABW9ZM57_9HYPH|nr:MULTISPECIES: TSUP family transporter [unclassified Pannonibacter]NBN65960.1 TSUP family transporter [Pannonibacter sp. XCT-34]NBN80456.1 TSUP family transporter [Pannonibacter sp. XCT-53]
MEFSSEILAILFAVALVAGWVDAIAGGGGLLTIPALLLVGVPPATALATNKLQGSFGAMTAAVYFIRRKMVSVPANLPALAAIAAGSVLGGVVLQQVDADLLVLFIPVLLVSIGIYFLFFARNLDEERAPRISAGRYSGTVAPVLGFYDGFFGPGTGSFMATSLVLLRGMPIRMATAHAKLFNVTSNLAALGYFVLFGEIAWLAGGVMILGQVAGAYLGAHFAFTGGARIIRPITVIMCFAMSIRVLVRMWPA